MFDSDQIRLGAQRVVIMGCGGFGSAVTVLLSERGHVVHVLDREASAFENLPRTQIDGGWIVPYVGDGTTERDLTKVSTPDADVFMALSGSDTKNAFAAQIAGQVYQVPRVICRIDDPELCEIYEGLGMTAVSVTRLAIHTLVESLGV